ncbi:MAG: PQQ-binding-like beta-propeller repeat protein, partial [Gemmatimonadales bacterium]
RTGDNLFAESIVCLDAKTGERVWHFQTVHHGLWDYDLPAPPILGTITVDAQRIDAVIVLGKTGFAYVFDRVTGEPVWPINERPVAQSSVPGERTAATQPFPTRPAPFSVQGFTTDDVIDFTPEIRAAALDYLSQFQLGPMFTPPSLEGTVVMPGLIGGAGWGGGAFDPETGILYVKGNNSPTIARLIQPPMSDTIQADYGRDRRASSRLRLEGESLPINKPPYGTVTAIDMNSGDHLWQVPVGDTPDIGNHPLLRDLALPRLGVTGSPGPMVTSSGLIFLTGGGSVLYALDTRDGSVLWAHDLGGTGYAVPMTYETANRQFVVIATGAGEDATLKAFALPN